MSTLEQLEALVKSPDIPDHIKRHFSCDCAERAMSRVVWKDTRSWEAVRMARLFAEGRASVDELAAASSAAWDAAWVAARDAAWAAASAAWAAAGCAAAWDAASAAARSVASAASAACDAARAAARAAAWDAAKAAAWDAASAAASAAAWDAERRWQLARLLDLVEQHKQARSGLMALLYKRGEQLLEGATPYGAEFEEVLFT